MGTNLLILSKNSALYVIMNYTIPRENRKGEIPRCVEESHSLQDHSKSRLYTISFPQLSDSTFLKILPIEGGNDYKSATISYSKVQKSNHYSSSIFSLTLSYFPCQLLKNLKKPTQITPPISLKVIYHFHQLEK